MGRGGEGYDTRWKVMSQSNLIKIEQTRKKEISNL